MISFLWFLFVWDSFESFSLTFYFPFRNTILKKKGEKHPNVVIFKVINFKIKKKLQFFKLDYTEKYCSFKDTQET